MRCPSYLKLLNRKIVEQLKTTLSERQLEAEYHDDAAVQKYTEIHGDGRMAFNPDNWHIIDEITHFYIEIDFPTKYSRRYTRYFFQEVFKSDIINLHSWLDSQFPTLDDVDVQYLEALMEQAREYKLYKEGALCLMTGEGYIIAHENAREAMQLEAFTCSNASDIFSGGSSALARVRYLRKWISKKIKVNDLAAKSTTGASDPQPLKPRSSLLLSDWESLLVGINEDQLLLVVEEMQKSNVNHTPNPAFWAGFVMELYRRKMLLYKNGNPNAEHLVRALRTWDVRVSANTLRYPSNEADGWQLKAKKAFDTVLDS